MLKWWKSIVWLSIGNKGIIFIIITLKTIPLNKMNFVRLTKLKDPFFTSNRKYYDSWILILALGEKYVRNHHSEQLETRQNICKYHGQLYIENNILREELCCQIIVSCFSYQYERNISCKAQGKQYFWFVFQWLHYTRKLLISIFNSLPVQKRNLSLKHSVTSLGALLYASLLGLFHGVEFLGYRMCVCVCSVTQSCATLLWPHGL